MWGTEAATRLAGTVVVERLSDDSGDSFQIQVPEIAGLRPQLVCPGDVITSEPGCLRGKGVVEREDGKFVATTTGVVERVNKLLYVRPLKHRYMGNVGDVVVGRILEVQADRWAVDIGTATLGNLHLGNVQLPGNVQRRRTDEDALRMRELYLEQDIISVEVSKVNESGGVELQARTARYGKLQNGCLAVVPATSVRRQAQHFVTLPDIGVMIVLGNNGWIWCCAPPKVAGSGRQETLNFSQMDVRYEEIGQDMRERICRVRNGILALAAHGLEVTQESIVGMYDKSKSCGLAPWELLDVSRCGSAGLTEAVVAEAIGTGDEENTKKKARR